MAMQRIAQAHANMELSGVVVSGAIETDEVADKYLQPRRQVTGRRSMFQRDMPLRTSSESGGDAGVRSSAGVDTPWLCWVVLVVTAFLGSQEVRAGVGDGRLPDGAYRCEAYLMGLFVDLGTITIKGNVYSGPAYGGRAMQGYNYQVDANGEISWLGPLGGFTSGGNSVSLTQVTSDGEADASFDIIMRRRDGGATAATCTIWPPNG
jgi:hypothetical protein